MLCKWTKAPACHVTLELHKWLHLVVALETESESESGKEGEPLSVGGVDIPTGQAEESLQGLQTKETR